MEAAIVGVAFRFPGANDAEAYWANIEQRKTSIIEVPRERWDWRSIWGDPKLEINKSNSKWGGFIDHVDAFEGLFLELRQFFLVVDPHLVSVQWSGGHQPTFPVT